MSDVDALVKRAQSDKAYTTVKHFDPQDKVTAYDMYMNSDKDMTDIAVELGIKRDVIAEWAKRGGWQMRKAQMVEELLRAADDRIKLFLVENRLPTLRRHLSAGKKLEVAIELAIDEIMARAEQEGRPLDTLALKRLAEALASVTNVTARAVATADILQQASAQGGAGRQPLVMIGVMPQAPAQAGQGPVIEVHEEERI